MMTTGIVLSSFGDSQPEEQDEKQTMNNLAFGAILHCDHPSPSFFYYFPFDHRKLVSFSAELVWLVNHHGKLLLMLSPAGRETSFGGGGGGGEL